MKLLRAIVKYAIIPVAIIIAVAGVEAGAGFTRAAVGILGVSTGVVVGTAPAAVDSFREGQTEAELSQQRAVEQRALEPQAAQPQP